jgi:hypothetical protein
MSFDLGVLDQRLTKRKREERERERERERKGTAADNMFPTPSMIGTWRPEGPGRPASGVQFAIVCHIVHNLFIDNHCR